MLQMSVPTGNGGVYNTVYTGDQQTKLKDELFKLTMEEDGDSTTETN